MFTIDEDEKLDPEIKNKVYEYFKIDEFRKFKREWCRSLLNRKTNNKQEEKCQK